ncbi:MAG: hypothetical protein NZ481_04780 [Candidatus Kapabacteria bacterium]|nr:hypothetical protein [Candidatus Kapabacteria bacterium]
MRRALALACFILSGAVAFDGAIPSEWLNADVFVRLVSGDELRGRLVAILEQDSVPAIKVRTAIGTARIDLDQIAEVRPLEQAYRHAWRTLLMPTAEPVGIHHSILSYELASLGAAIGIGQVGSLLLLRSIVPGIPSEHQLSMVNFKATVLQADYQQLEGYLSVAVGGNIAWINSPNRLQHVWVAGTFTRVRSRVTVMSFLNLSDRDVYQITAGTFGSVAMRYARHAVGFGLALDVQMPARDDLHVLAELWNSDLSRPYQTMVVAGVRLANTALALDAGVGVASQVLIPLVALSWTPW